MLAIHEHMTVEEASGDLLGFVLVPDNWLPLERQAEDPSVRPVQNAVYQRRVGPLRICACVDVSATLDVSLRVAFRAPGLTPVKAADHLETFLRNRMPLTPNSEWQVEVDERRWIHFVRRYTGAHLQA
ncbi:hypothetical protein [Stigmatella aurantiaca]|nr:hypothetical protein [Stigmatella aurantiaca]